MFFSVTGATPTGDSVEAFLNGIVQAIPPLQQFITAVAASRATFGFATLLIILVLGILLAYSQGYKAMGAFALMALVLVGFVFVFVVVPSPEPGPPSKIAYIGHPKNIANGDLQPNDFVRGSFVREADNTWTEIVGAVQGHPSVNKFKLIEEKPNFILLVDDDHPYCPTSLLISFDEKTLSSRCYKQAQSAYELLYIVTDVIH